jgi:hypothetical protein
MRHGDVGGFGRVGQRAHADKVHAGLGIGADVLKHDAALASVGIQRAARSVCPSVLPDALDRSLHFLRRHVVEQDRFGAIFERLFQLLRRAHFHLHALALLALFQSARQHRGQPPPSAMWLFLIRMPEARSMR